MEKVIRDNLMKAKLKHHIKELKAPLRSPYIRKALDKKDRKN